MAISNGVEIVDEKSVTGEQHQDTASIFLINPVTLLIFCREPGPISWISHRASLETRRAEDEHLGSIAFNLPMQDSGLAFYKKHSGSYTCRLSFLPEAGGLE